MGGRALLSLIFVTATPSRAPPPPNRLALTMVGPDVEEVERSRRCEAAGSLVAKKEKVCAPTQREDLVGPPCARGIANAACAHTESGDEALSGHFGR
jgi:hypothetical protein